MKFINTNSEAYHRFFFERKWAGLGLRRNRFCLKQHNLKLIPLINCLIGKIDRSKRENNYKCKNGI